MENVLEVLTYLVDNFGKGFAIVFSILFVILWKFPKAFSTVGKLMLFGTTSINKKVLLKHSYFSYLDYLKRWGISNLEFGCRARNSAMKDLYKIKCDVLEKNMRELINNKNLKGWCKEEGHANVMNKMKSCIKQYSKIFIDNCNTEDEKEVCQLILAHVHRTYKKNVESNEKTIKDIWYTRAFKDNNIKMYSSLFIFLNSIEIFTIDAEESLSKMNGNLSGKLYRGVEFE